MLALDITLDPHGNLQIRGDQSANVVHVVYHASDGLFRIDADGHVLVLSVPGPRIDISLRGGDDRVRFGDEEHSFIPRRVSIDFGDGDDAYVFDQNSFVSGGITINMGGGDDLLLGEDAMLARNARVRMGRGEDVVSFASCASDLLVIDTGPGSDRVSILDQAFNGQASIALGQGDDELEASGFVSGALTLNGGAGSDALLDAPDEAKVGGFE